VSAKRARVYDARYAHVTLATAAFRPRRTAAPEVLAADPPVIILRHTDIRITQRYAHASNAALTDAASWMGRHCGRERPTATGDATKGERTGVGNDEPPAPGGAA
jgi:hypothetical protein